MIFTRIHKTSKSGFTLIELLLYMALSTIMVIVIGNIGVDVLTTRTKAHALNEVQYNAQFVTNKIRSAIRDANGINTPTNGVIETSLSLSMQDASKNPTVFDVIDEGLRMQEGSDEPVILSGGSVKVAELEFSNVTHDAGIGSIRFKLRLEALNPENSTAYNAGATFYTTESLRYMP